MPKNKDFKSEFALLTGSSGLLRPCWSLLGHSWRLLGKVEREQNILSLDEARAHEAECNKAMLDELTRWLNLGAFERFPKKDATNVIDARWVLKWKEVNGKRIIHARLVVRGFKDLQACLLYTSPSPRDS